MQTYQHPGVVSGNLYAYEAPRDNQKVLTPPRRPQAKARPVDPKARPIATPMVNLSPAIERPIMRAALSVMSEAIEQIRARI